MAYAEIYNKGGTDKTVITNVRTALLQGFQAPNWKDLRFGWFVSITDDSGDDTITGLSEDIGANDSVPHEFTDRYAIGIGSFTPPIFLGYTNIGRPAIPDLGRSRLVSSDVGIGTSNANYWRCKNGRNDDWSAAIIDGRTSLAVNHGAYQPHFAQANIGAGGPAGYATLLMIRYRRDTANSRTIRMEIPSTDQYFSSTPTKDILQTQLQGFPATAQQIGPVELSAIPTYMYLYWPFVGSRLRLHCCGFLKSA